MHDALNIYCTHTYVFFRSRMCIRGGTRRKAMDPRITSTDVSAYSDCIPKKCPSPYYPLCYMEPLWTRTCRATRRPSSTSLNSFDRSPQMHYKIWLSARTPVQLRRRACPWEEPMATRAEKLELGSHGGPNPGGCEQHVPVSRVGPEARDLRRVNVVRDGKPTMPSSTPPSVAIVGLMTRCWPTLFTPFQPSQNRHVSIFLNISIRLSSLDQEIAVPFVPGSPDF
ncbi:hypothetical protein BD779DRAFT_867641 [Infundibulicybe gibba]|nr:hypothetical protein BD779DRAFT_867641 [Infundibulicybe gibba]